MKLFTSKQIAALDQYTIKNEPVSDIDLMERASMQITNWLVQRFSTEQKMVFLAGPGNNGGDALAIARQMAELGFVCEMYQMETGKEIKGSPAINRKRLVEQGIVKLSGISTIEDFEEPGEEDVVIDGLYGSGLNRPLEGLAADLVKRLNQLTNTIVAIDIPSGLMGEDNSANDPDKILRADFTLTFQFPKISFLFAENEQFTGKWKVLPIGLHKEGIAAEPSAFHFIRKEDVQAILPGRSRFDHKGTFGHALLIAGSFGKMGAAVLASKACLRAGVGLLTTHVPRQGYNILQTAVPEAMASVDQHDFEFTETGKLEAFSAIGIGPGLGQKSNTQKALLALLEAATVPLVLDADALNILALHKDWLGKLPGGSILTPHPGEFKRMAGETGNSHKRMEAQIAFSKQYRCIVVLKGAFTSISTPDGTIYFNSSGNPGMATGGSGDVLTGIILGLLAQGMSSEEAAIIGVYIHGLAGDIAADEQSENAMIAGDITDALGKTFKKLQ